VIDAGRLLKYALWTVLVWLAAGMPAPAASRELAFIPAAPEPVGMLFAGVAWVAMGLAMKRKRRKI